MAWKYFLSENAILPLQIFLIAALCNTATPCLYDTEDALMLYPNGTDVVQAVISKLHSLHFKMCDRHLLRRIALVETADGTSIKLGGGIWALNESKFSNVAKELHEVLRNKLCWNVTDDMLYDLLGQPLVSGLAATLYLNYLKNNRSARIPLPGNITGQAQFWRNYYHSRNLTEDYFVEQVKGFESQIPNQVNQTQEPTCLNHTEKRILLENNGRGSALVQAVISKLHSLRILTCDHHLLRRIAFVETYDGISGVPDGGIWALNERKFNIVSSDVDEVLSNELCLNVSGGTPYTFLNQSLVSGLAASLYLNHLENNRSARILSGNIKEQAQFWKAYYHSRNLTVDYFVEQVKGLESQSVSQVKQTQKQPQTMAKSCLNSTEKRVFLNDSETGSHIVQAVISKLRSIQILMCDHRLLRRIALVETNDGINDVPDGGIWAVSKNMFNITSSDVDEVLSNRLCINGAVGNYLKTPLVSGLAASLYLNHLEKSENARIPLAINIEKQADFWIQYYHTGKLTSRYFVEQVQTREMQTQVDQTNVTGANGSDVVEMVNAKISLTNIFNSDHRLLRRIAYVETDDGTSGVPPGGIWAVDESKLKTVLKEPKLREIHEKIDQKFEINFNETTHSLLMKPLFSGLVACLYLHYLNTTKNVDIPLAAAISDQAKFWHSHYYRYNGKYLTVDSFTQKVRELERREGCLVNSDIFFVLDVSASIGKHNFHEVQKFERNFVQNLTIGPDDDQVGTIIFDHNAVTVFKLNDYNDTECVLDAIDKIPYLAWYTNVIDALCRLKEGYEDGNGARPLSRAVFRIAIVLTDGISNHCDSVCGWNSVEEAAEAVHKLGVLVYVIAVGSFDYSELEKIASRVPGAVTKLDDFSPMSLGRGQEKVFDDVCKRASQPISTDEERSTMLSKNKGIRYNLLVPVTGITVQVCITEGHIRVYGSVSVPNPNPAFHDFFIELDESSTEWCGHAYVESCPTQSSPSRSRRDTSQSSTDDQVVYISIEARDKDSSFAVNGIAGDVYRDVIDTPTPNNSGKNDSEKKVIIVTASTSGSLLLLSCLLIIGLVGGTVYHYKKKKTVGEDEYHLLSQDDDCIEFQ